VRTLLMTQQLKEKTILFLDDCIDFALNSIVLFEIFAKQVYHAKTIKEAQALLSEFKIDIIISDIKLKQENGLDFIEMVRQHDKQVPIIILSAHKDETFLLRSIPLNLTAFLLKPIKYDEIIEAFRKCSEKINFHNQSFIELKGDWIFDTKMKILSNAETSHLLHKKEALFIELLALNRDRIITKEMVQQYVWERDEMTDSALTNFILRIRRRFGKNFIYTIPALGYRFNL